MVDVRFKIATDDPCPGRWATYEWYKVNRSPTQSKPYLWHQRAGYIYNIYMYIYTRLPRGNMNELKVDRSDEGYEYTTSFLK